MIDSIRNQWHHKTQRWLDKRIPASHKHQLNHNSIFIFPSKFGFGYLVMCASVFVLGTNYQNNLMLLLCYFLIALFLLNLFTSYMNFSKLIVTAQNVQPVFAGHQGKFYLQVTLPQKNGQVSGLLNVKWWQSDKVYSYDLDQHPAHLSLPTHFAQRGKYRLPRVMCYSYFPLGLYRCWTYLDFNQSQLVYPNPIPTKKRLHDIESDDGNSQSVVQGHDDFSSLKEYQPGDALNHIAWKQMAKNGEWVSKSFDSPITSAGFLKLNEHYRDIETEMGKLAFQVLELSAQKATFGLQLGKESVAPNSGELHKHQCLQALALYPGEHHHGQ